MRNGTAAIDVDTERKYVDAAVTKIKRSASDMCKAGDRDHDADDVWMRALASAKIGEAPGARAWTWKKSFVVPRRLSP